MNRVITAFLGAVRDLREARILALVLVPPVGAFVLWTVLAWAFWSDWIAWADTMLAATAFGQWVQSFDPGWLVSSVATLVLIAIVVPLMLITVVVITELAAMPVIVKLVGHRHFGALELRRGGTVMGSVWNAVRGILWFAALWLLTLPLWLTGIGALVLPPLLSAWFTQRMFRYDALAEHASVAEYRRVVQGSSGRLILMGLLLALLYYVPVLNLVVPVLSGLAFTHLCLGELARIRQKA
ncbi:MAG: EI24 domain-containing protein [Betaproteobacteria bacterium]|nr:EI24 domain-containing protein [Betaproteobacteria bacterium]MDH3436196.1 EI24 domain-containing protein [Betaproteobacteria bacterium]